MVKRKQITSKESKRRHVGAMATEQPASSSRENRPATGGTSTPRTLHIELLSDTTFSRGEGTAGIVDAEVEHDDHGMPFIGGKTIRGLLRDGWLSMAPHFPEPLQLAAKRVLGDSQALDDTCRLRISDAVLPDSLRAVVQGAVERPEYPIPPSAILEAFTSIRYQTAEDRETGAPAASTLRSSRVVVRGFSFESRLLWLNGYNPDADDLTLLALCTLSCRHGGLLRNRGRGHLRMTLDGSLERTQGFLGEMR